MSIREQLEAAGKEETTAAPVTEAAPSTPAASEPAAASSEDIAAATATMQEAAYTPNYKFKYTGKNGDKWGDAEGEFDPEIKSLIKSKEDEEKWKKNYSKLHGFDFVADGREKARGELKQFQEQWSPIIDLAHKANKALTQNDMDAFFEHLGLPYEKVQAHVFNKLQMQDLRQQNPNQYQLLTQNQQLQKQTQSWEEKMADVQHQNLQIQQDLLQTKLNYEYQKPEVTSFKSNFEAANGDGSFYQELQIRADFIHRTQNRIPEPGEVIQDVLKKFNHSPSVSQPQAPTQQASAPAQVPLQVVPATQKPTIPVIGGGGQSPSSKSFKTLADLRAHRATLKA